MDYSADSTIAMPGDFQRLQQRLFSILLVWVMSTSLWFTTFKPWTSWIKYSVTAATMTPTGFISAPYISCLSTSPSSHLHSQDKFLHIKSSPLYPTINQHHDNSTPNKQWCSGSILRRRKYTHNVPRAD